MRCFAIAVRRAKVCAMTKNILLFAFALLLPQLGSAALPAEPRQIVSLSDGWSFRFGEAEASVITSAFDDSSWERVSVPHTWNRIGEYALERSVATNNKQGVGWYRLTYNAPPAAKGRRQYLDFAAVAIIADVWVNGTHVGQHKGAFSRFRFDVTAAWKPGAANLIAVKADNSKPAPGSSTQDVLPLAGDFFIHGGIYRGVQLITANDASFDVLDYGGPGIYVTPVWKGQERTTGIEVRIRANSPRIHKRRLSLRFIVRNRDGKIVAQHETPRSTGKPDQMAIDAGSYYIEMPGAKLWNGVNAPYLYSITAEMRESKRLLDSITQTFGIRDFNFDANAGAILNGKPVKLKGVSRHQDRAARGYALTREDHAEDMAIIKEMGANSIRQAHYQHADEWSDEADTAGMLVWAEVPFVTTPSFTGGEGSPELFANAERQTRELIRQNYNHPSIMMWSVGNEVDAATLFGASSAPVKPLKLLQHITRIAREEDPSRPTVFADCCEDVRVSAMAGAAQVDDGTERLAGAADLIGYNRYYGWYYPQPLKAAEQLAAQMDKFHAKHPTLPLSISEYGAGGAISQHSDNPTAGFINAIGRPQPEEYENWVHEQSWPVIRDRPFIWGSYIWNMFDFASDLRNEGDSVDINTKGLVTMDRKVRKDAFYYYKAQWSNEAFIHITGKRYSDRAYPVMEVKAYTNAAESARLFLHGNMIQEVGCTDHVCIWSGVVLRSGANEFKVVAVTDGITEISDTATFIGPDPAKGIRINAGDNAVTFINGTQYGSDNFVTGGTAAVLNQGGFGGRRSGPQKTVVAADPALFDYWREGETFSYAIPLPDGKWTIAIHSFEPSDTATGTMSISVNGKLAVPAFSIRDAAGGTLKGVQKSFAVVVTNGLLKLDFSGQGGKAVVAAIEISR